MARITATSSAFFIQGNPSGSATGEILFTEYESESGPCVMKISCDSSGVEQFVSVCDHQIKLVY